MRDSHYTEFEERANALLRDHPVETTELRDRIAAALREQAKTPSARVVEDNQALRGLLNKAAAEVRLIRAQFSGGDELCSALDTLERMLRPVEVVKIERGGQTFYSPLSEARDFTKLDGPASLKVVWMSEEEYRSIPATPAAAEFFGRQTGEG